MPGSKFQKVFSFLASRSSPILGSRRKCEPMLAGEAEEDALDLLSDDRTLPQVEVNARWFRVLCAV